MSSYQKTIGTVSVDKESHVVIITPIASGMPGPASGVNSVTGDGVGGTATNVVMTFPTVNAIGAYSNTNPSAFINVATAPVQSVNGATGTVVLDADDVGAYSNTNPNNFIDIAGAPVQSVNGATGIVVLDASDIGAYSNTNPNNFIDSAGAPVQSVNGAIGTIVLELDDIDDVNIAGATNGQSLVYNSTADEWRAVTISGGGGGGAVDSVNGQTGVVVLDADDVGAYSNTNPDLYINVAQASAAAPIQTVTGTLVTGTASDPVIDIPTVDQVGAYSNTNPSSFIDAAGAPVQSVNGDTGIVVLDANSVGAYSNTNPDAYIDSAGAPVQSVNGATGTVVLDANSVGAYSNTNPDAYINVAQSPVQSVNGATGIVVIDADDVGAYSNTNPLAFINVAQASNSAPVQTVTGDGVDNTNVGNVVVSFPTVDDIGAYSNTNPSSFIDSAGAPVQSVNGDTGVVVLTANDVGAYSNTNPDSFINIAQASAGAPVQSVNGQTNVVVLGADDVGAYSNTNPSSFIDAAGAPVQSVNGDTGVVVLDANDVGAYSNTNPSVFINVAQAGAAAPVQSVTGTLVGGTSADPVINIPTLDEIGAYSNTNPSAFINVAQAPVQSVNGSTGIVVITADDIGAYSNTNPSAFVNATGAASAAPVQSVNGLTGTVTIPAASVSETGLVTTDDQTFAGNKTFTNSVAANSLSANGSISLYTSLIGSPSSAVIEYIVTVVTKTSNHRYFGIGSSLGYHINGIESPFLTLLPGKTYRFLQDAASNAAHQLRFYLQADKTTQFTTDVTFVGNAGSAGAYTQIVVTDTTPIVLHYQCVNHAYMGNAGQFNSAAPVQTVTGTLVSGTNVNPVINIPSLDQVGAYSNTNPSAFINVYPSAGMAVSTGSAWTTSKATPTGDVVGTSDTQTLTSKTFTGYTETVFTLTDAATITPSVTNGTIQSLTLGANRTVNTSSINAGQSLLLMISTGGASRTITWTTVYWMAGSAPTLATTGFNGIELWKVGSNVYGAYLGKA